MQTRKSVAGFLLIILSFFGSIQAQTPGNEPCAGANLTVNPVASPCATSTTFIINNTAAPSTSYFTNSTSASAGVTLPAFSGCNFTSATNDFWYKITVPASGYFSVELQGTNNQKFFDWVMYTASSATCAGSVFTEVPNSLQCAPNTAVNYTNVGPLTPGSTVYLRMWLQANINQGSRATFIICVNQLTAPQPIPACPAAIFPANNAVIGSSGATLVWGTSAFTQDYLLYFRNATLGGAFTLLTNTTSNTFTIDTLSYNNRYEWYVTPVNTDLIANTTCASSPYSFTLSSPVPTLNCAKATQICIPEVFKATVDQIDNGSTLPADSLGCLGIKTNPSYRWFKATTDGDLRLNVTSTTGEDIDFAIWGPFTGITPSVPVCGTNAAFSGFPCGTGLGSPVDCDNSSSSGGDIFIDSVHANDYFLLLVTNPSNNPNNIQISKILPENTVDFECPTCSFSSFSATPNASGCNNDVYSVAYSISMLQVPTTGTLTISDGAGHSTVINAPFPLLINGTLNGLTADGQTHQLTATFSATAQCVSCASFTAPAPSPSNNNCAAVTSTVASNSISGYVNNCTGVGVGEPNYCSSAACKTVFYKFKTATGASGTSVNVTFDGGNLGFPECTGGIRVAILSNCTALAPISPSCQTASANSSNLTFSGLTQNTDYYLAVAPVNCASSNCSWNMRLTGLGALPVKLGSFEVIKNNRFNSLQWNTLFEQNIARFELLRSADGVRFSSIGSTTATNQINGSSYQFNDYGRTSGLNYYQIKVVNRDGTVEYSPIRQIDNGQADVMTLVPNPVKNFAVVGVRSKTAGKGVLEIVDGTGRIVRQVNVSLVIGNNQYPVDFSSYSAGILYVRFTDNNGNVSTLPVSKL